MAKIPFSFGGGGDSSDDCTAEAADVLEGKTAIYNGSEDDAVAGTMKDYSGTSQQATGAMNSSSSRVEYTVPATGKYDTAAKLYLPYSTMRSLIGYTDASKVLTGTTICGLAGTMADRSGTTTSATASLNNSNLRLQIPNNGYYNTSAYLQQSYSNIASLIGLTADKLVQGNTILGISGTQYSKGAPYSGSLYFFGEQLVAQGWGSYFGRSSTGTAYSNVGDTVLNILSGNSCVWAVTGKTYDLGSYSTIRFRLRQVGGTASTLTMNFLYGSSTSSSGSSTSASISSTFSITEFSINISSLSGSYYIGLRFYNNTSYNNVYLVDHIWLA